jgi:hypothetical protein
MESAMVFPAAEDGLLVTLRVRSGISTREERAVIQFQRILCPIDFSETSESRAPPCHRVGLLVRGTTDGSSCGPMLRPEHAFLVHRSARRPGDGRVLSWYRATTLERRLARVVPRKTTEGAREFDITSRLGSSPDAPVTKMNDTPPDKPDGSIDLLARSWFRPSVLAVAVAVTALVGGIVFVSQCSGQ